MTNEIEFNFYRHPSFRRDFIRIVAKDGRYSFDWEKDVVEKGPMFLRVTLKLAEWKRRELEIRQQVEAVKASDANPLELNPNFMGFGIDLLKAVRYVRRKKKP